MSGLTDLPVDTLPPEVDREDGEEGEVLVQVSICGPSGLHWAASGNIPADLGDTDELVASTILRAGLAAASLHGPGAWIALQRLCTDYGRRDVA